MRGGAIRKRGSRWEWSDRTVAKKRTMKKKSPDKTKVIFFLSRPLVRAFPFSFLASGRSSKDLDPSLLSLSTVSLSFSERRRYREESIPARKDPEFASQAPRGEGDKVSFSSPIKPRKRKKKVRDRTKWAASSASSSTARGSTAAPAAAPRWLPRRASSAR